MNMRFKRLLGAFMIASLMTSVDAHAKNKKAGKKAAGQTHAKRWKPKTYREYYDKLGGKQKVYHDHVDEDGALGGGSYLLTMPEPEFTTPDASMEAAELLALLPVWDVTTIVNNGPTGNRLDWVIVGDGYSASATDRQAYADHVNRIVDGWFAANPFTEYASYFNVHRVEVISNESGIDDPGANPPVDKDTILGMYINTYLIGIGNLEEVWKAIGAAPDYDLATAIANTTAYGGLGYQGVAAASGNNTWTVGLVLHEMGHSFGGLADEYVDSNKADLTYTGNEPSEPNASIYSAGQQAALQVKWYRWLDLPHIDSFEGSRYYGNGIYRPTDQSTMNWLDNPYYEVNAEQLIFKIYSSVSPIDDATPDKLLYEGDTLYVVPMQPATHSLDVQWSVDGVEVAGATDTVFTPDYPALTPGNHTVSVTVVDNTPQVRDEEKRAELLTDSRSWTVYLGASQGTLNVDQTTVATEDSLSIEVADGDLANSLKQAVNITSSSGDSETFDLIEAPVGSGIFKGFVNTGPGSAVQGNGRIDTSAGSTITISYTDNNNGSGQQAVLTKTVSVSGSDKMLVEYDPGEVVNRVTGPLPATTTALHLSTSSVEGVGVSDFRQEDRWVLWWPHNGTSVDPNDNYLTFTVTPENGYAMKLTNVTVRVASWTGKYNLSLRTNIDGFVGNSGGNWDKIGVDGWAPMNTFDVSSLGEVTQPIEVRVYIWGDIDSGTAGWHDLVGNNGLQVKGTLYNKSSMPGQNAAPMAFYDSHATVAPGSSAVIDVLDNDVDPNLDPLTITAVSKAAHGTVVNNDVNVTYTPDSSFTNMDVFSYTVSDGRGGKDSTSVLVVKGAPVNHAPVFASDQLSRDNTRANAYYAGQTLAGSATDSDAGDTLTYSKLSGPAWLTVAPNGALSGTPGVGDVGVNIWTVQVSDGRGGSDTATLEISVLPDAPASDDSCPGINRGKVSSAAVPLAFSDSIQKGSDDADYFSVTAAENGTLTLTQTPTNGRWVSFSVGTICGNDNVYSRVNSRYSKTANVNVTAGQTIYFWMDTTGYINTRERAYAISFDFTR